MSQPSNDIHLTVLETKFYMSPDLQAMALADLKEHVDDFEDTDPDEIRASSTLEAALALFLWQTQLDPETGAMVAIDGDMGLTMTTDNNTLFEDILGPHVAKGSYIAVAGGNRTRWCWYFNGEGCQVKPVELAFEPFQALAKEINEGPCPR